MWATSANFYFILLAESFNNNKNKGFKMNKINLHIGHTKSEKEIDGLFVEPYGFDLTKYPSLFINRNTTTHVSKNDTATQLIIDQIKELARKNKNLKTVIIENGVVSYCSFISEYDYRKKDPEAMMKRMCGMVNKIYERYVQQYDFVPYTKYVIIVKNANGLEKYLVDIMEKLGPIGVYLVFSGDHTLVDNCPDITSNLFGQILYIDTPGFRTGTGYCGPSYEMLLERLKPEHTISPEIISDKFYAILRECYNERCNDIFAL